VLLRRAVALALAMLFAATPAVAAADCGWVVWQMGVARGDTWYKPITPLATPIAAEVCRQEVKQRTDRWRVGLIAYYPDKNDLTVFYGCLPAGYDPYEGR
jgi:hypothetical protein